MRIDYCFTTLNEYIKAERGNKFAAANIKKKETEVARVHFLSKICKTPCKLKFIWHVKNKRKDLDNITFAKKFILDGMVKANAIENDNLNHIVGFIDEVIFDGNDYVEIERMD